MSGKSAVGFSLVEVLIGLLIVAFVAGGFIAGIQAARKEVEFSDKHVSVLLCSQKIIEDLHEELWLNPFGFQTLGIEESQRVSSPITNGQSMFFSTLEFQNPTDGRGSEKRPRPLSKDMGPLYNQVQDLNLALSAHRLAAVETRQPDSNLYQGSIQFDWKGTVGKGESEVRALFFSPLTAKKFTPADFSALEADDAYTSILGGSRGTGTGATGPAAGGAGADRVRSIGEVYLACRSFLTSEFLKNTYRRIDTLGKQSKNLAFPSKEMYACHQELATLWYEMARRSLHFLMSIEPSFTATSTGFDPTSLGDFFGGGNSYRFRNILTDFRLVYEVFVSSMLQARANYQFLTSTAMAKFRGARYQYQLLVRLIDIYRILCLVPTTPKGLAEYRMFLTQLEAYSIERNPYLKRFVGQERLNAASTGQLAARLPNLKTLEVFFTQKIRPALQFTRTNVDPKKW